MNSKTARKIEECKRDSLMIRERRKNLIESLNKLSDILDIERLIKKLSDDIKTSKEITEVSLKKYVEIEPVVESKTIENSKLAAEVDTENAQLESLESEVGKMRADIEKYEEKNSQIDNLKEKISVLEKESKSFEADMMRHETEIKSVNEEISSIESNCKANSDLMDKLSAEVENLSVSVEDISRKIIDETEIESKRRALPGLTKENVAMNGSIEELKAEIDTNLKQKADIETDIDKSERETAEVNNVVEKLNVKYDALKETVISKDEVDKLQNEFDAVIKEIEGAKNRIIFLENEIGDHTKGKEGIIKEVEDAKKALESITDDYISLKEKIELYEKEPDKLDHMKTKISDMGLEVAERSKKNNGSEEEHKHLNRAFDILRTEHTAYKEAMDQISELLKMQ